MLKYGGFCLVCVCYICMYCEYSYSRIICVLIGVFIICYTSSDLALTVL